MEIDNHIELLAERNRNIQVKTKTRLLLELFNSREHPILHSFGGIEL